MKLTIHIDTDHPAVKEIAAEHALALSQSLDWDGVYRYHVQVSDESRAESLVEWTTEITPRRERGGS